MLLLAFHSDGRAAHVRPICTYSLILLWSALTVNVSSFVFLRSSTTNFQGRGSRFKLFSVVEEYSDEITKEDSITRAVELGRSKLSQYFDFPLDDWQLQAGGEILLGHNVIVSAPTGSG